MIVRSDEVTCIFGLRGMGKTTLARKIIALFPRWLAFDPLHQSSDLGPHTGKLEVLKSNFKGKAVFQPVDAEAEAEGFFEWAYSLQNLLVYVEEVDMVKSSPALLRLVRHARNWGIGVLAVTRRPAETPPTITSQAARIICFRLRHPRDLEYIEGLTSKEFAERVRGLAPFAWEVFES